MRQYVRLFQSELYKLLHSPLAYIHLFVPLLGITVFLAYYRISPWDEPQKIATYLQILAMIFPVLIAVITTFSSDIESQAGFFQGFLSIPCKKSAIHMIKLIVLFVFGLCAAWVAVVGFGMLFQWIGNDSFSSSFYIKAAVLLFLGNVPLYILHYTISFTFAKGIGLGLGIVGSLLSALLLTGIGDTIWYYLPWSISIRMCSILVESEAINGNFMETADVRNGFEFIITVGILFILLFIQWGARWEAPKCEME